MRGWPQTAVLRDDRLRAPERPPFGVRERPTPSWRWALWIWLGLWLARSEPADTLGGRMPDEEVAVPCLGTTGAQPGREASLLEQSCRKHNRPAESADC